VARIDFRLDANDGDKPYILEVNPLPGLNPGYSDLCIEAAADGWSYEELINGILNSAIERYDLAWDWGFSSRGRRNHHF
jgi:D-alanine-D-alanine ligase